MKKLIPIILASLFLVGCSNQKLQSHNSSSSTSSKQVKKNASPTAPKPDIHKKYPGLTLMTIPSQFRGTWYRSDPFSKNARKLVITDHLVNNSVLYKKTGKFKLDHNSAKQNKEYAGDISLGRVMQKNGQTWLRVRDILGSVDLIYITGNFKGHECLYLAYSSGDIHSAIFKDAKTALKYRKYDFSKVNQKLKEISFFFICKLASFDNYLIRYDVGISPFHAVLYSTNQLSINFQEAHIITLNQEGKTALITESYGGLETQFINIHASRGQALKSN